MKKFNITAQIYSLFDKHKQTILMNDIVSAESSEDALDTFKEIYDNVDYKVVKIYSVEEIVQVAS